jgi:hypothetical protein
MTTGHSLAVCLTGQLRLFPVSFPALVHNLLQPAAAAAGRQQIDLFYVGPSDLSFEHGWPYMKRVPNLRAWTTYSPRLRWRRTRSSSQLPIADLLYGDSAAKPTAKLNSSTAHRRNVAVARFNIDGLQACSPMGRLQSRLVQALQARECLRLIESAEAEEGLLATNASAGGSSATTGRGYSAILRMRADMLTLRPAHLPRLAPLNLPTAERAGLARSRRHVYSSLAACPSKQDGDILATHDFALHGERRVMGHVLGVLDGLTPAELTSAGCDVGRVALRRLRRDLPEARCIAPRNGSAPVASVRGSVRAGCFFLDQEHPPNDGEAQPRLSQLYPGADAVGRDCLRLAELRDGRRPEDGRRVCEARGGWDGDFRDDASPWDDRGPPNRGSG